MANKTKLQKATGGTGNTSYMLFVPKALVEGLGLKIGNQFEWTVIQGGFKVLKVKE